jgi:type VI secretion system secreted protein Hcp
MSTSGWRRWLPTGVAAAAVTTLVVMLGARGDAAPVPVVPVVPVGAPIAAVVTAPDAALANACTPAALPGTSGPADYFLKLDGIPGESTDAQHPNEIVIGSFSWGINGKLTGCAAAPLRAAFAAVSFVKHLDKSSPKLASAVATGHHIATAVLTLRKAGDQPLEFLVITLKDVLVTSYSITGLGDLPQDSFSLQYSRITFKYTTQNPDGSPGTSVAFCFDVRLVRAC